MSRQIQLMLSDEEIAEIREAAERRGVPVEQWVRTAVLDASRLPLELEIDRKLAILRVAAAYGGSPSGEIDEILADIERGRTV